MAAAPLACLVRIRNGMFVRAHIVVGPEFIIGRAPDVQVPIISNTISRNHVKVEILKDTVKITDLRSNNGTYIDGVPMAPDRPMMVQPVNCIKLGQSEEEISFLPIPMPVELMEGQRLKSTLQVSLIQAQREIEEAAHNALLDEKKAAQAAIQLEREQSRLHTQTEFDERMRTAERKSRELAEMAQKEGQKIIARAKQEASQLQSQAFQAHMEKKRELEIQIDKLQAEASIIIAAAKSRAEEEERRLVSKAHLEARAEMESARQKADVLFKSAQDKYQERMATQEKVLSAISARKIELEKHVEGLQVQAKQLMTTAENASKQLQETAKLEAKQAVESAKSSAKQTLESAHSEAKQIISAARAKAQSEEADIIFRAKAAAKIETSSMQAKADQMLKAAQDKYQEIIAVAEKESRMRIEYAQKAATEVMQKAQFDAKTLNETGHRKINAMAEETRKALQVEIDEKRRVALDSVRIATLEEQERIVSQFKNTIDQLRAAQQKIEPTLRAQTVDIEMLEKKKIALRTEVDSIDKNLVEKRHHLSSVQTNLDKALKTIELKDQAELDRKTAETEANALREAIEGLKEAQLRMQREQENEVQDWKERKLLVFKDLEKKQHDELVQKRLQGFEQLKRAIQDEEAKYKETLTLKSLEIARAIESRLLPSIETAVKNAGAEISLGFLLGNIRSAVDEVVLKQRSSIQAVTEGMGVDPEKVKEQKRRVKRWVMASGVACVLGLAIFGKPLFFYLRELAKKNSYAESIVAQRVAESIYTPVQSDDWKETYTGNILYLRNYFQAKTDPAYEKQWTLKLNDLEFLRSLGLNEDDMAEVIGKESALVHRLWELRQSLDARYLDDGLSKMNEAELESVNLMRAYFKTPEKYDKLRTLERDFTQQFIKRRFGSEQRLPSSPQHNDNPMQEREAEAHAE
jgi:pSer/pThr/pTyr-binding forkhead associated (FHA) protein